jgi:cytoskeletal protein CcmA (bactofilin family)
MANIIKIKRGAGVPASGVLAGYELGWDYTNDSIYLGVEGAAPLKIADAFAGFLSINKATGLIEATNNVSVGGSLTADTLSVSGATIDTNGNATLPGTLNVTGVTTVSNNLIVTGTGSFQGNLTASSDLGVTGHGTIGGNLGVSANTTLSGLLTANGVSTFNNAITVTTGNLATFQGGIDVNGNATIAAATGNIVTAGDITAANAVLNGNLTVHGTTTTVEIADPIFSIGETLASSDAKDRGLEFNYGSTASPLTGFFGLDESTGRFTYIPDATNTSEVFAGLTGDYEVGNIFQPQLNGVYETGAGSVVVNASDIWNTAGVATANMASAVQFDLLQADVNGIFSPTKTIPSTSGITIDCGTY